MSSTLNLLSDSTFGTKIDEQNGILEDIRDSLGGGLDTSALVYGGTPDADSVVQLKKKDPVSGNDVNVYPALAPASSLGRYLFPALPTQIDWTNWNSPECFMLSRNTISQEYVLTPSIFKRSFASVQDGSYTYDPYLCIRRDLIDPDLNLDAVSASYNILINLNTLSPTTQYFKRTGTIETVNNTQYFQYILQKGFGSSLSNAPVWSLII